MHGGHGHRVIISRGALSSSLNWNLFWLSALHERTYVLVSVGVRRRNGKMSVNLSLFVLLYNTNFMNKLTVYIQ